MKNVVVTGGSGFIGSWLVEEMLQHDIRVWVIVRDRERLLKSITEHPLCTIIEGDIMHMSKGDFEIVDYDVFFHLAWAGVSSEKKNDLDLQLYNIQMAIKALELCKDMGCKMFIGAGTVAEYVFCEGVMDVDEKQTPNDMYGAAKVSTHYFLEVKASQLAQPFIWAIIPSTYGERREDNNIITYTIKSLLKKQIPQYGNLEQMWDFLYVGEVARALRLIGEKGKAGKTYGIGSGVYRPLKEYIISIRDLIDPNLALQIGALNNMSKRTFSSCVNIERLKKDTGFMPGISFEQGMKKTIEYFKNKLADPN